MIVLCVMKYHSGHQHDPGHSLGGQTNLGPATAHPPSQGLNFSYDANLNLFLDSQQFAL